MKIVIAPDSFKESLSAENVARAIADGIRRVCPSAEYVELPIADGGEGTVATLTRAVRGELINCSVHDPLMRRIDAQYGVIDSGRTAVIEVAAASGLPLLSEDERDPTVATSFGTGELIVHALECGARKFIVGLGGSATNDGGAGIAQALGFRLLDGNDQELTPGGLALGGLVRIDDSSAHRRLADAAFRVACDVDIPLCGSNGSTHIYSAQKGASSEQIVALEDAMRHYADVLDAYAGRKVSEQSGAGAAGGIGAGLVAFASAELSPGFDLVASACHLEEHIRDCDLVITGEGKIDAQTLQGKVPSGVAGLAQKYAKPVIVFCGTVESSDEAQVSSRFDQVIAIDRLATDKADAMENASRYLASAAESFARDWA